MALLAFVWPRLLIQLDSRELTILLVGVGIATVLIPVTRDIASRLLDRYVYRTRANYRRTVREASQMLTRVLHLERLLRFISTTIVQSTAVEGAALYLRENGVFQRAMADKRSDAEHFDAPDVAAVEVVAALDAAQEPLLADELARERGAEAAALHRRLEAANWALLLPVLSDDGLIALIAVGPKLSGDAFYQEDLDLLMTLANQAGVAIKNAKLYTAVVVANEYLENIAATMESGVIAIDQAGRVAMFNRAAERLTGLATDTVKNGPATALPACLATPLLATVADGQLRTQPDVELPHATPAAGGPTSRPVICTVSPVRDPMGGVLGAVAVVSDLTPFKELEVERRRAERLAYFQALVSGIAHEIKNPMVAIRTFAQLLPRRLDDARFLEEFSRISTRETDRILHLLERLRTLSRPVEGRRHPIDLRRPLADVVGLMGPELSKKGVVMTAGLGSEPCVVNGNHDELVQLFLNLVVNAQEATPSGGRVSVDVARTDTQVIVTVADTGPGIPPELQERIFEPLYTTKARGSGLGLAISAGIAQTHAARLRAGVRPTGGAGAIFTVEFPASSMVSAEVT